MIFVDTSVLVDFFKDTKNDPVSCFADIIKKKIPFFHPKDTVASYEKAAMIYFVCRKKGITVRSTIDCLIAQIAIEHNLFLLHNDKDFEQMAPIIGLELYPLG